MPVDHDYRVKAKIRIENLIKENYEKNVKQLFSTWNPNTLPKPNLPISKKIAALLNVEFEYKDKWPYWLPIPVKEAGTRRHPVWMLPSELQSSLVFKNEISYEDEDPLLDEIQQYAIDEGLKIYELATEWEPLYRNLAEIRGIQLIEGDTNLVLEKSVNFLIESSRAS